MLNKNDKKNLFLKKSYNARRIFDILANSPHIVILHKNNFSFSFSLELQRFCHLNGISYFLVNKESFNQLAVSKVAYGPTLVLYSNYYFLENLDLLYQKFKIKFELILNKNNFVYLSSYFRKSIFAKFENSFLKTHSFLFFYFKFFFSIQFFIFLVIKNNFIFFAKMLFSYLIFIINFFKIYINKWLL